MVIRGPMARSQYKLVLGSDTPPPGTVRVEEQEQNSVLGVDGAQYLTIAHTQWGDIPGKVIQGKCWFSHNSVVHCTQSFSYLVSPDSELVLIKTIQGEEKPVTAVKVKPLDDLGELCIGIAQTEEWGYIPGKVKDETCYYVHNGEECDTSIFFYVCTMFSLEKKEGSEPPSDAVEMGWEGEDDGEELYLAVAHTCWGDIPGKAKGGKCWFSYKGLEHQADSFSYLVMPPYSAGLETASDGLPKLPLRVGFEAEEGGGDIYAAVADTDDWGTIPGKARGNQCWYGYGGKEHITSQFSWVTGTCDSDTQGQKVITFVQ